MNLKNYLNYLQKHFEDPLKHSEGYAFDMRKIESKEIPMTYQREQ